MSDTSNIRKTTTPSPRGAEQPAPRDLYDGLNRRHALFIHVRACAGMYARPCDRIEKLARLVVLARQTDRCRGHAGTEEQNEARVDLEQYLGELLWDECRLAVLDAGLHPEAGGWADPRVRQDAHDLLDDVVANAKRAVELGDYARRPSPDAPDAPPPAGGAGSPARVYRGFTTADGERRVILAAGGTERDLPPRNDLRDHSPTGLNWGYGGSGPAQLALALLADALGDDARALRLYQDFKWSVVAGLDNAGWTLVADEVRASAERIDRRP